ncbi:MAG: lipopolysaccharide biosynthesis protein [Verrucomicrobiota bacterium]
MRFLKDTTIVGSGTIVAQAIQLAATPWLARVYTPAEFGVYASFVAVAGALATASCLRFDVAIGAASEQDVNYLLKLALLCTCGFAILTWLATPLLLRIVPNSGGLDEWRTWFPVAVISGAFFQIGNYLVIRRQKFLLGAEVKVLQAFLFVAIASLSRRLGLIGAQVVGQAAWLLVLVSGFPWSRLRRSTAIDVFTRFKDYPLYSAPAAVLDTLAVAMPILIITRIYGDDASGHFSRVRSIIGGPLLLLASSLSPVFFSRAARLRDQGQPTRSLLASITFATLGCGLALLVAVLLAGQPTMRMLLGAGWRTDTWFLIVTMLGVVFKAAVTPVTSIFFVEGRVKAATVWQLLHFLWSAFGLSLLAPRLAFDQFLCVLATSECVSYCLYFVLAAWPQNPHRVSLPVGPSLELTEDVRNSRNH